MKPAITIDAEFRALIPPLTPEEFAGLESSLIHEGCRDALVVWNGVLVDGHNRYDICQKHGLVFKTKEIELADRDCALDWIETNQLSRRNLPPQVMSVLRGNIYNRRKKTKAEAGSKGGSSKGQSGTCLDTAETVAKETGVSPRTIKRDGKLAAEVAADPKLKGALNDRTEFKKVRREKKEAKREDRREKNRAKIATVEAPEAIEAKFATILIDPPWDWGDEGDHDQLGRAKPDYATLSIEELMALPLPKLADDDCHLFCWITNRSLPKGFVLLEHWGFRYITMLTWPKPHFGMGNYFRGQTEHLLFGVKGSQPLKRKNASTLLPAWKRGPNGHSSKPVEIHEFIESVSPGPFLEMFSRSKQEGWTTWGESR